MPEDQPPRRALITPPPGLLPDAPREELEGTDSGTRRLSRVAPTFFPAGPGAAPSRPLTPAPGAPDRAAEESTVDRPVATWTLRTPDGVEHPIPVDGLIIGRNPSAPEGREEAALLGVLDPEKTVSKTHAELRIAGGALIAVDLDSTNGTTIVGPDSEVVGADTGRGVPVPSGSTLRLGSFEIRVARA